MLLAATRHFAGPCFWDVLQKVAGDLDGCHAGRTNSLVAGRVPVLWSQLDFVPCRSLTVLRVCLALPPGLPRRGLELASFLRSVLPSGPHLPVASCLPVLSALWSCK